MHINSLICNKVGVNIVKICNKVWVNMVKICNKKGVKG